jgi:hypothetical protein
MNASRFGFAEGSAIQTLKKLRKRKNCRRYQNLIEQMESRVLLSATMVVTGNAAAIANGEAAPTFANFTNFGDTTPDGTLPLTRTFTIAAESGQINTVSVSLSGSSVFALTGSSASTTIAQNGDTTFTITFTPNEAQSFSSTVTIDSSLAAYTFEIDGTGDHTTVLPSGVEYAVVGAGTGTETAQDGDYLVLDYTLYEPNGTFNQTSLTLSTPFQFELGLGQVIQGWDQGVVGMQVGETRALYIPFAEGYGASGSGTIPGDTNLIFSVTLHNIITVAGGTGQNVNIPADESDPTTGAGTYFGDMNIGATPVTNTFTITDSGDGSARAESLSTLFTTTAANGIAAVSLSGVGTSAFTVTQPDITTNSSTLSVATITATYTATPGISDANVEFNVVDQFADQFPTLPNGVNDYSFAVEGQANEPATGYVDGASWGEIFGWAYDPANPTASINVEVVIDGGTITQTFSADVYRGDLTGVIGSANHGYQYYMPILSAGTHSYAVYAIDTTTGTNVLLGSGTVVSQNSLFDEGYYLREYPAVAAAVTSGEFATGYAHYLQYGQFEGYSPSPLWDESVYLAYNSDVAAAVTAGTVSSGFMQFYLYGQYENRPGLFWFNTAYYLQQYTNVASAVTDGALTSAFQHFSDYGQYEGYNPTSSFNTTYYVQNNGDIDPYITGEPFTSAYDQYIEFGYSEGRVTEAVSSPAPSIDSAGADGTVSGSDFQILEDNLGSGVGILNS